MTSAYTLAQDEGTPMWVLGTAPTRIKATGAQTGGDYALFDFIVPPNGALPLHIHHNDDESIYVLEGAITVFYGEQRFDLEAGGFVFLPRGTAHGYRLAASCQAEGRQARVLEFTVPSGLEALIVEISVPATDLSGPPPLAEQAALTKQMVAMAPRCGLEIVGPLPD